MAATKKSTTKGTKKAAPRTNAITAAKPATRPARKKKAAKLNGKLSQIGAAAMVLAYAGQAMSCKEIVKAERDRGQT